MLESIKGIFNEETEVIDTQELDDIVEIDESFEVETKPISASDKKVKKGVVKVYEPVTQGATTTIMDSIKRGELCVVNFNRVSEEEARAIYSNLNGSVYALDGELRKLNDEIIICAPKNFLIDGEVPK